nr:MAG TPA: hypothetical protein [Caudoviricetes sp.]
MTHLCAAPDAYRVQKQRCAEVPRKIIIPQGFI